MSAPLSSASSAPLAQLEAIGHAFGETEVLRDINLSIAPGSYTVLLGPSGSGKTTLLSVLGGFVTPTRGKVRIDGVDVTDMAPARRPTATVFQDYALFPHMTILDNVAFGLRMRGVDKAERRTSAAEALALVGLDGVGARRPHALSGGQRQRVALARALVIEPRALLLDEPLGALDLALRRQMQDELKATQKRVGAAFVHVTHDQEEAMALADLVVVMNDGRIEDAGPPERVYARPATRFTATFMGESTVIEGTASPAGDGRIRLATPIGGFELEGSAEGKAAIAIRPEALKIGTPDPAKGEIAFAEATIGAVTFQGSFRRVHARMSNGAELLIKAPAATEIRSGRTALVSVRSSDLVLLTR